MIHIKVDISKEEEEGVFPCRVSKFFLLNVTGFSPLSSSFWEKY
jgi:hypothetical protein